MVRLSAWVTEEQKQWVEERGEEHESGQAGVIRDLIDAARETESLSESESDSVVNQSESPTESLTDVAERLEAVADRLEAETAESPVNHSPRDTPVRSDASESSVSDSTTERMDTSRQSGNAAESGGASGGSAGGDVESAEGHDEVAQMFQRYLENRTPQKRHAKDAVATVFTLLREHGTMETGELKAALYERHGDRYASEKGLWESLRRYLEEMPGIEKAGYGEWGYEGDDVVREELGGD